MQIKTTRTAFVLVRHKYDAAIKRGRAKVIARLHLSTTEMPEELLALLTPAEQAQLADFLLQRKAQLEKEAICRAVRELPEQMRLAALFYRMQPEKLPGLAVLAAETRDEISKLLAAQCAAGVGRKRSRGKKNADA